VLPYRGSVAAGRELRGTLTSPTGREDPAGVKRPARSAQGSPLAGGLPLVGGLPLGEGSLLGGGPAVGVLRPLGSFVAADFRLTVRRQMALAAVAEFGGRGLNPNNREVSEHMGVSDQGQVSRLMMRMEGQGLVENTRVLQGRGKSLAKAWRLTAQGQAVIDAHQPLEPAQRKETKPRKPTTGPGDASRKRAVGTGGASRRVGVAGGRVGARPVRASFRLTARTHLVLAAIAELGAGELTPDPSNREIARAAGVKDQGQISRLLVRLESHGLVENSGGGSAGLANAWRLSVRGEELLSVSRPVVAKAAR
jgi:DNA-binding MarR family transcriptional regulator